KSSDATTPVLPTEEPEYSLSIGYEHLSTTPETALDEVIKSSAKNLVPIPSEYEVTFDDEKGDIYFLKELLSDDSIPLPENESSNFDHHDDTLFPRPPPKPPDIEFFFDFEPNSEEVILDKLNEDESFDPGGEIYIFANIKDDDYFPFMFVIRIFLPYLIYPEVSPLFLSAKSEDTIFDPVISV
nr:hypothetical protein [Tanacetum cinerariifolium]